jgi:hypothetical protein
MSEKATPEEVEELISLVKKKLHTAEVPQIALALGISVPTYYMWKAKGMPKRKFSALKVKFSEKQSLFPSGRMIRPRSNIEQGLRIWVSAVCAKCRDEYQIACSTLYKQSVPESEVVHFDFGTFICPDCARSLCI